MDDGPMFYRLDRPRGLETLYLDPVGHRRVEQGRVLGVFACVLLFVMALLAFVAGALDILLAAGVGCVVLFIAGVAVTQEGTSPVHRLLPARCPRCDAANPPGSLNCEKCRSAIPPRWAPPTAV